MSNARGLAIVREEAETIEETVMRKAAAKRLERRGMLQILESLGNSPLRYGALQRATGLNSNTLCARLRELVELRLVERHAVDMLNVEYSLTEMGEALAGEVAQFLQCSIALIDAGNHISVMQIEQPIAPYSRHPADASPLLGQTIERWKES